MTGENELGSVLLVDDDETFRRVLGGELARRGYAVVTAGSGEEAVEKAVKAPCDVILLDLRLPDLDGIEILRRLREREVGAGVIVLTGHGTIDTAIQAVRMGADEYLEKPCPIAKVELAIQKAREHKDLLLRQRVLSDAFAPPDVRAGFLGESPAFRRLCQTIERVARTGSTVLIQGETGVGKEMVAKRLHAEGPRRDGPFVVVDCAALDEDLLRSELFGHEKGAFTGAARLKHGLFEVANGGTLFLDEVGDATPEIQAKLLRVLETGRFRRVGGTREVAVDVRVLSATNRDLKAACAQGRFREDLWFRLASITIEVPPLRERREDVPLLVEHYVSLLNRRFSMDAHLTPEAVERLRAWSWPGNVRELVHVLEQAIVLSDGKAIGPDDLPPALRKSGGESPPVAGEALSLRDVQRRHVLATLAAAGGNRAQAASRLGISERNLYRLLKRYGGT